MKIDNDLKEFRKLDEPSLRKRVNELKENLFNLSFQNATGQLKNTAQVKSTRRTIARLLTIINEKKATQNKENSHAK
jgi:large subunit ribosomal protein L29